MTGRVLHNPLRGERAQPRARGSALAFHRTLPGYAPTPLVELPALAAELGVARVVAKDESSRLGLPSFKIVGASWATAVALLDRLGRDTTGVTFGELHALVAGEPLRLMAATDGNHGRAIARMAALLDLACTIFVPSDMVPARIAAIDEEGAEAVVVDAGYDEAVARSAREADADPAAVLVSDTSWPGYERIPTAVIEGYSTIMLELDDQLAEPPDLAIVQVGVGAFAAAVVSHLPPTTRIAAVEPTRAACLMESLAAGRRVAIPGPHDSIMSGLNCGTPSLVAWPTLAAGLDVAVAVEDDDARAGMRALAEAGIAAGECAGAAPAGVRALRPEPDATVLLFVTEGVTDPTAYDAIMATA